MAIMGFLAHCEEAAAADVERRIAAMREMTTYGIHQGGHIVAVAEAQAQDMEALLARVQALDGVLACYVTSLSTEDEDLPPDPPQGMVGQ